MASERASLREMYDDERDAEIERLTAQLAERDAEINALVEPVRDAIDCLERALGAQRPYSLTRTREVRLALDTLRTALAARGGEGRDGE